MTDGTAAGRTTCADEGDTLRSLTNTEKEDSLPESEEERDCERHRGRQERSEEDTHRASERVHERVRACDRQVQIQTWPRTNLSEGRGRGRCRQTLGLPCSSGSGDGFSAFDVLRFSPSFLPLPLPFLLFFLFFTTTTTSAPPAAPRSSSPTPLSLGTSARRTPSCRSATSSPTSPLNGVTLERVFPAAASAKAEGEGSASLTLDPDAAAAAASASACPSTRLPAPPTPSLALFGTRAKLFFA